MEIRRQKDLSRSGFDVRSERYLTQIARGIFLGLVLVLVLAPCRAQTPTAQLTGLVTDPSGASRALATFRLIRRWATPHTMLFRRS